MAAGGTAGAGASVAEPPTHLLRAEFQKRANSVALESKLRKHLLKLNNSKIKQYCLKEGLPWTLRDLACYGTAVRKLAPGTPVDFHAAVRFIALVKGGAAAGGGAGPGLQVPHGPPAGLVDRVAAAMREAAAKYDMLAFIERQCGRQQQRQQQVGLAEGPVPGGRQRQQQRQQLPAEATAAAAAAAGPGPSSAGHQAVGDRGVGPVPAGPAAGGARARGGAEGQPARAVTAAAPPAGWGPAGSAAALAAGGAGADAAGRGGLGGPLAGQLPNHRRFSVVEAEEEGDLDDGDYGFLRAAGGGPGVEDDDGGDGFEDDDVNMADDDDDGMAGDDGASDEDAVGASVGGPVGVTAAGAYGSPRRWRVPPAGPARPRRRVRGTAAGGARGTARAGPGGAGLEDRLRAHLRRLGNSKLRSYNRREGVGWSLLELVVADRDVRLQQGCTDLRAVDVALRVAQAKLPRGQDVPDATLQAVTINMREAHFKYQLGPFVAAEVQKRLNRQRRNTGPAGRPGGVAADA